MKIHEVIFDLKATCIQSIPNFRRKIFVCAYTTFYRFNNFISIIKLK